MSVRRLIVEVDLDGLNVPSSAVSREFRPGSSISCGDGMPSRGRLVLSLALGQQRRSPTVLRTGSRTWW